jgi:hypothetical protein
MYVYLPYEPPSASELEAGYADQWA